MNLVELLLQVGVDVDRMNNEDKAILYKNLYLNNIDDGSIEHPLSMEIHPLSMEIDADGDLSISF